MTDLEVMYIVIHRDGTDRLVYARRNEAYQAARKCGWTLSECKVARAEALYDDDGNETDEYRRIHDRQTSADPK